MPTPHRVQELELLLAMVEDYFYHFAANPHTLLCRFFGVHTIRIGAASAASSSAANQHDGGAAAGAAAKGARYHFVVMDSALAADAATRLPVAHSFDLKGAPDRRTVLNHRSHQRSHHQSDRWVRGASQREEPRGGSQTG